MKTYKPPAIPASEITPQALFHARREFMQIAGGVSLAAIWPQALWAADKLAEVKKSSYGSTEELTPLKDVSRYNNFYEFGTSKDEPAVNATGLKTRPWTVTVEGEVKKPKVFDIGDLLKMAPLEERVYRLRCVEAWSMVVPWVGYSLAELIKRVEPTGATPSLSNLSVCTIRNRCRDKKPPCSTGPIAKACGWTKPCIP